LSWQIGIGEKVKIPNDWREFIELLNANEAEYLVVGGHAVGFHGHPRLTGDIDFFVNPTVANADALLKVLAAFGFADLGDLRNEFSTPMHVVQLGHPPFRIDLLTSISGVEFDAARASSQPAEAFPPARSVVSWAIPS
jgi:hypothetical protein